MKVLLIICIMAAALVLSGCVTSMPQTTGSAPTPSTQVIAQNYHTPTIVSEPDQAMYIVLQKCVLPSHTENVVFSDDTLIAFPSMKSIALHKFEGLYPSGVTILDGIAWVGFSRK